MWDMTKNGRYDDLEQLELEQPIISKKSHFNAYSVEREYVNSKDYHDKFERMPVNRDVQQNLYLEAGRLLEFVDGQEEERMIAVNARTGDFLVDNFLHFLFNFCTPCTFYTLFFINIIITIKTI